MTQAKTPKTSESTRVNKNAEDREDSLQSVSQEETLLMWFQDTFLRSNHFLWHMKGTVKHRKPCALKYFLKQFID